MRQNQADQNAGNHHAGTNDKPVLCTVIFQLTVFLLELLHFPCHVGDLLTQLVAFIGDSNRIGCGAFKVGEFLFNVDLFLLQGFMRDFQFFVGALQFTESGG